MLLTICIDRFEDQHILVFFSWSAVTFRNCIPPQAPLRDASPRIAASSVVLLRLNNLPLRVEREVKDVLA